MTGIEKYSPSSLNLNIPAEIGRIVEFLRSTVHQQLRRQGVVLGLSGGIDSSVALGLCVEAFGSERVLGLLLPEKESSPESSDLALALADQYHIETITEDITPALEGLGCYRRRNEAICRVIPEFKAGWNVKIVLPGDLMEKGTLNVFKLIVADPDGNQISRRIPLKEYYQIVAASNFKQRTRTQFLYYHGEARNYAVIGTPNKNEHDLGFFVKYGDGGYDVAPIRHLFKTQVYQLAAYLGVPEEIYKRPPTTDTYPGGGTQEEFFYRISYSLLDSIWYGFEHGVAPDVIAQGLDLQADQVERVVKDIQHKQFATSYLRMMPYGIE